MRILTVSSFYPPDYLGGYELACSEVMSGLRNRGHEVCILTSKRRRNAPDLPDDDQWIHRVFDFAPLVETQVEDIVSRARREWRNNAACRHWVDVFDPDVISVWDFWGLLPSLLTTMERTEIPVTYAVSSRWVTEYTSTDRRWPAFWDIEWSHGVKGVLKKVVAYTAKGWIDRAMPISPPQPDLRRAFFCSHALRDEYMVLGWPCSNAPVIYHGVDIERFSPRASKTPASFGGRLLVSGRVVQEKGIHVAIEALALLFRDGWDGPLTLDIVGPQPDPDYVESLRRSVACHDLERVVCFHQQSPREAMPDVYQTHDVFIFSSVWEEPFALTMLEVMACGVPVVGTVTGGSKEVLEHGVTGLVFEAGDARSLAGQLRRILTEPGLGQSLADNALQRVRQDFTIEQTVERVEGFLSHQARN